VTQIVIKTVPFTVAGNTRDFDGARLVSQETDVFETAENSATMKPGQYITGTQEYGRFNLNKRISFGLHKRAFLKALDAIRRRGTWSLS
jgi:hypothetical protein